MKVISYTALHYGSDYLYHAIKSVIDHVDEHHVLYSPVGSHGARADMPCPDSRGDLYDLALLAAGDKLRWHDGEWPDEGKQRESIHLVAGDADVILVVDADEIWPVEILQKAQSEGWQALHNTYAETGYGYPTGHYEVKPFEAVRNFRVPMIHYWRSFYRAVLHDPSYPIRIILPKVPVSEATLATRARISHMGYAQRPDVTFYKQYTHGHRSEWRWQEDWFHTIFMTNRQYDCHPVGSEYWNPEQVNPWDYMPDFMKQHPYANLDVIGDVVEVAE